MYLQAMFPLSQGGPFDKRLQVFAGIRQCWGQLGFHITLFLQESAADEMREDLFVSRP